MTLKPMNNKSQIAFICQKDTSAYVFFWKFCEISKSKFLTEPSWVAASVALIDAVHKSKVLWTRMITVIQAQK